MARVTEPGAVATGSRTQLEWQYPVATAPGSVKAQPFRTSGGRATTTMIEIVNRQRRRKINARQWREFGEQSLEALGKSEQSATIVFVADEAIKTLNRKFRGKNYATDVLSFPSEAEVFEVDQQKHLGEVVISVQRAAAQARDNDLSFSNELKQLILHGLLHLAGYDHETDKGEMDRLEVKLRKRLDI